MPELPGLMGTRGILGLIAGALALAMTLVLADVYLSPRHVLVNNSGAAVHLLTQHEGRTIPAGAAVEINPFPEVPLALYLASERGIGARIKFGGDGVIELRDARGGMMKIQPPDAWAVRDGMLKYFRYQLNADGKIYLLGPLEQSPVDRIDSQPAGFPIATGR